MASDTATAEAAIQTEFAPALGDYELLKYIDHTLNDEETFHFLGFEYLHRVNIVRISTAPDVETSTKTN